MYYKIIEYVLLHYKVSYSYSLGHNGQATKFSISVRCDINLNLFECIDYVYLENHLNNTLIKFQILYWTKDNLSINSIVRFGAPAKMAKYFEFTNNHSDVFVVGNSQLAGFTGVNKDKDCGMNISMCRGAKIEDCLEECDRRNHNMRNKMVLIHGLQNSVMDIKKRKIDFFKDVIGVVEKLNSNNNGNVFVLCQTDYTPRQTEFQGLRRTIDWINSQVNKVNRKMGFESPKPWMALTEITTDGKLYQRIGAWKEKGNNGYHVSDQYRPLYEQQFFLYFKDLPVLKKEKFATKKKDKARKTSSSILDLRQRIHQKKEKKVQDAEKELKLRDRSRSPLKRSIDDKGTRSSPGPSGSQMVQFQNSTINFNINFSKKSNLNVHMSNK